MVVGAARTAIGDFGGALKSHEPVSLAAIVIREALSRARVDGDDVGHVVFGQVIHTTARDMYLPRVAAMTAGVTLNAPAFSVNRLCGSGLQAVLSAAQSILLGDTDVAVAGGAESMSRAGYLSEDLRWGKRMGNGVMTDMLLGALTDPFGQYHMGVTAEHVAKRYGIGRDQQDRLAEQSHARAAHAIEQGYFKTQIVPIQVRSAGAGAGARAGAASKPSADARTPSASNAVQASADAQGNATSNAVAMRADDGWFNTDEHVRADMSLHALAQRKPAFIDDGTVTAGNASSLNDGAAALVLMEREVAQHRGLPCLGRLVAYAHAGVDPAYMGMGPVPATRAVLDRAGLTLADIDVIEANEAFAAQACAVAQALAFDPDRLNPNGSGIALGHPIGATGAILVVKALYELQRIQGRFALVTMCIGGGQGIAAIFER